MRVGLPGDLAQLQRVLVAVVRNNVNIGFGPRGLGLDTEKAAGDVPAVDDPIDRVACKDVGDLFLRGQDQQRRLKQGGIDDRRRCRRSHDDRARRIGLRLWRVSRGP